MDKGRKNLATDGLEHIGRLFYEDGISTALECFINVQSAADPHTMILVELAFLQQEFRFCDKTDTTNYSSLTQAIQNFEDSFRVLKTVENSDLYKAAETTYPTASKYRYHGFPRDAIHLACASHWARLQIALRKPGISMIEKKVITQRIVNMTAIQWAYFKKQKKALAK